MVKKKTKIEISGWGIFGLICLAFVLFGVFISEDALISLVDLVLFLMSLISLSAIIKSSERIVHLSEQYGLLKSKHSDVG